MSDPIIKNRTWPERAQAAHSSAQALIDHYFKNPNKRAPIAHVPSDRNRDDDLILYDFISDALLHIVELESKLKIAAQAVEERGKD